MTVARRPVATFASLRGVGRRIPPPGWVVAIALLAWLLEPNTYPSYDYVFAMTAGQDILAGRETGYVVALYSPVAHPLTILVSILIAPLGSSAAFAVFTALILLAFGTLVCAVFACGKLLAGWPAGLVAAALTFLSPVIFELGVRTYGDVAFASFAFVAALLEARRPRRGWPVLALLAVGGLIRPEAWALAGLYWLWLFPRRDWATRAKLFALVAAPPLLWSLMDLLMTGDALHSIQHTQSYTEKANAHVGLADLWDIVSISLEALMPWPVMVTAALGALFAWRFAPRAALAPVVMAAVTLLVIFAEALIGDAPVLRRYLVVPGAGLALLAGVGLLGWLSLDGAVRARRPLAAAALVSAALLAIVAIPEKVDDWESDRRAQEGRVQLIRDLRDFAESEPAERSLSSPACAPVNTPGYGFRPYLRWWLDLPPKDVAFLFDGNPRRGTVLLPTSAHGFQRVMLANVGLNTRLSVLADEEFRRRFMPVATSESWQLYAIRGSACARLATT